MDNFNLKKYLAEGKLFEEDMNVPNFRYGWEIIDYLDNISKFHQYRNKEAEYDDEYYLIPTDIFTQVTGWTEEDVNNISDNLEPYEGNIYWTNTNPNQHEENTVSVHGGS